MGQVIRKLNKTGKFLGWYVRWVDSDGKRKAKATKATSATEARRLLVEIEAAAGRRQLGIPERPQPIKGTDLIARWLDEATPRATDRTTWAIKARYAVKKVVPDLGVVVTVPVAARIVRSLIRRYAPGTVKITLAVLKAAWNWAAAEGIVEVNPWKIRVPSPPQRVEYLSRDEVASLLVAADAHRDVVAVAVRLAVFAGLRVSEIFGLRWRSVDLDRGVITIRHGFRGRPTKSRRERVIPIADQLHVALVEWKKRCLSEMVCPSTTNEARFRRPDLRPLYRRARLPLPAAPWHILRHTFASHFLMSGGSLLTLQRLLGHSSVAVTQVYSHLSAAHVAGEIKKLRF